MEIKGKVKAIFATKEVSSSFKSREIVVTTDEQFVQHISVQFMQDKCGILDGYKVGENVVIGINLRGREWLSPQGETKYFNTIQGWKINKDGVNDTPVQNAQVVPPVAEDDDLPF
jgi:hypothetical protein